MASSGIFLQDRPRPSPQEMTRSHHRRAAAAAADLQFIHFACPSESNSGQRLSLIRSHAAKQVHAVRRNNQLYAKEPHHPHAPDSPSLLSSSSSSSSSSSNDVTLIRIQDSSSRATARTAGGGAKNAGTENAFRAWEVKKVHQVARKKQRPTSADKNMLPSPVQLIGATVKNACCDGFAWTPTHDELRLFEYYTQWVLKYGFAGCVPLGMETYFFKAHTTSLLPFTMARPALLSGMFYIAARRLSLTTDNASEVQELGVKVLRYRLRCLELMKEAIGTESMPTDETITLGMMMCSEAYRERDIDATRAHAAAVFQMVTARGGLKNITALSGFLEFLLATSIWDPRYKMLTGPGFGDGH